jgi:hypothetical protein
MGCLNPGQGNGEWKFFANIHLSGPCNRACYFCIGQHMMALDKFNNLDEWPLKGLDEFLSKCQENGVREVYLTGTNTEPMLYRHHERLVDTLRWALPGVKVGIRTNGALVPGRMVLWRLYDKASITICSFDPGIYRKMMGRGVPPNLKWIVDESPRRMDLKVNIVLGPENTSGGFNADFYNTLDRCDDAGITRVNLREPYGQPYVGNPLSWLPASGEHLGMPYYIHGGIQVTYWDVHYVEVESVNLYASGKVSVLYPISKGHDDVTGKVLPQSAFPGGRIQEQWQR